MHNAPKVGLEVMYDLEWVTAIVTVHSWFMYNNHRDTSTHVEPVTQYDASTQVIVIDTPYHTRHLFLVCG